MDAPEGVTLATIAALVLAWSLVGKRAERWGVTAPMAFIVAGVLLVATVGEDLSAGTIKFLAEITLVLVLFHDASTVRIADLRRDPWISVRLLAVGFPLALAMTTAAAMWLLPAVGFAGAVLIAGAITPTDAGLGAPTILNPAVPVRVRRALNVESGLNDGLATPIVLAALGVLVGSSGDDGQDTGILSVAAQPVAEGLAIGAVLGVVGALLLDRSKAAGWSSGRARALAVLALPLLSFGLAEVVEGNAFIAAFVGGLVFGRFATAIEDEPEVSETLEIAADLFGSVLWFLAGGLLVLALDDGFTWRWVVTAVLALTVLRVVPVALALLRSGFHWPTVLFVGWFGPRGIATIVFGLLAVEELVDDPLLADVGGVLGLTVVLSVFAHGMTAGPLSAAYGAWASRTNAPIESEGSVEPMPSRGRKATATTSLDQP
jgi:NhaP-type Na+/H+ or K+/H+ antiporter